jgi:hypothetical protein
MTNMAWPNTEWPTFHLLKFVRDDPLSFAPFMARTIVKRGAEDLNDKPLGFFDGTEMPRPARKFPAPAGKDPCAQQRGIGCKSLKMQHQLILEWSSPRPI